MDKVRASRDGHEYHEVWTARLALRLILPTEDMIAIAVEGLKPSDHDKAASATVEVADLVIYHGDRAGFEGADRSSIIQFKYSIANRDRAFRASDAKKTVAKFAETFTDLKKRLGAETALKKVTFELYTNQPVFGPLRDALEALASGNPALGESNTQAKQLAKAAGLSKTSLKQFCRRVRFVSLGGNLSLSKHELARAVISLSGARDHQADRHLGSLRQLVRDKAGSQGEGANLIRRTDVLASLEVSHPDDLMPFPPDFGDVGPVVERGQLQEAIKAIEQEPNLPVVIHAAGGVGKTVFLQEIASQYNLGSETVLFDCFGGGAYRAAGDERHLAKRGLVHLANSLACRGLCDPLLPGSADAAALIRAFRRRLEQCTELISSSGAARSLYVFVDAIDNAEIQAAASGQRSFPLLLLESLSCAPIGNVHLVLTCRSERLPPTDFDYRSFELRPFTKDEAISYVGGRLPDSTPAQREIAYSRSLGNGRILQHLVEGSSELVASPMDPSPIELDQLLEERVRKASAASRENGYKSTQFESFLAGLGILPTPIPLQEYSAAHGLKASEIESVVADLYPLLECTSHGILFRDEPTETFIKTRYSAKPELLEQVSNSLLDRQAESAYAARALPALLTSLERGEALTALAFDERVPSTGTSVVGERAIRQARLSAAAAFAGRTKDYDGLTKVLIELSAVTAADHRGFEHIVSNPALIVAAADRDAERTLVETPTSWPGLRHARLAIFGLLAGEGENAVRNASTALDWIDHHRRSGPEQGAYEPGPEPQDFAAILAVMISRRRFADAAQFSRRFYEWYGYEVSTTLFEIMGCAGNLPLAVPFDGHEFLRALSSEIGVLAAALQIKDVPDNLKGELVSRLARACRKKGHLTFKHHQASANRDSLQDGLRRSAVVAMSLGRHNEANVISLRAPCDRPGIWSFRDIYFHREVFAFAFRIAIVAARKGTEIHEKDLVPNELVDVCRRIPRHVTGSSFRVKVKERLSRFATRKNKPDATSERSISYDDKQRLERFLDYTLAPMQRLVSAFSKVVSSSSAFVDGSFRDLINAWEAERRQAAQDYLLSGKSILDQLGLELVLVLIAGRNDLGYDVFQEMLESSAYLENADFEARVECVKRLAQDPESRSLAGKLAQSTAETLESERDTEARADRTAELARAILPASRAEAATYFRSGLNLVDAIGSADYRLTSELLMFGATLTGDELDAADLHTLTNICELNFGEEPAKFPWADFAAASTQIGGLRTLCKIGRWHDRDIVRLDHSLLPCLTALVRDEKIDSSLAVALNSLADPVELWCCGTRHFLEEVARSSDPQRRAAVRVLIEQYLRNNSSSPSEESVQRFADFRECFAADSDLCAHLDSLENFLSEKRSNEEENGDYFSAAGPLNKHRASTDDKVSHPELHEIVASTNPNDAVSLASAFALVSHLQSYRELEDMFFELLQQRVDYSERTEYLLNIAQLDGPGIYSKVDALSACIAAWSDSSLSLKQTLKEVVRGVLALHADDLVDSGFLLEKEIAELSMLSEVPVPELAAELTQILVESELQPAAETWIALARLIVPLASVGIGQASLSRRLRSDETRISRVCSDGLETLGLYPDLSGPESASSLIWRILGSPRADDRWRAAHSVVTLAKLDKWDVIDNLFELSTTSESSAFGADELPFFSMHAQLWFLIAIARVAIDHPKQLSLRSHRLLAIADAELGSHLLMRWYAKNALLACVEADELSILPARELNIREIGSSRIPRVHEKTKANKGVYATRPADRRERGFSLHPDFQRSPVDTLATVFGKPIWDVEDGITDVISLWDANAKGTSDSGNRSYYPRRRSCKLNAFETLYGDYLAWHAVFSVAGKMLESFPITDDSYADEPWDDWIRGFSTSRADGRWLADSTGFAPVESLMPLVEKVENEVRVCSNETTLMQLIGLPCSEGESFTVDGSWSSPDDLRVRVSSALVSPDRARSLAQLLVQEEPMDVYIPHLGSDASSVVYLKGNQNHHFGLWIETSGLELGIDGGDPLGSSAAACLPRLPQEVASDLGLAVRDDRGIRWMDSSGKTVAVSSAWGRQFQREYETESRVGSRITVSQELVKELLHLRGSDLLVLVTVEKYDSDAGDGRGVFRHSVAVVHVDQSMDIEFFAGKLNHAHRSF